MSIIRRVYTSYTMYRSMCVYAHYNNIVNPLIAYTRWPSVTRTFACVSVLCVCECDCEWVRAPKLSERIWFFSHICAMFRNAGGD